MAVKPHFNYSELAGPGFLLNCGCCNGSISGVLQQTSPSGLTCTTEPKTLVLTGRANYPDNAFLIKNQLRAKLRDFPFAQASVASVFSGKGSLEISSTHPPPDYSHVDVGLDISLGEAVGTVCSSLMYVYYLSLLLSSYQSYSWKPQGSCLRERRSQAHREEECL